MCEQILQRILRLHFTENQNLKFEIHVAHQTCAGNFFKEKRDSDQRNLNVDWDANEPNFNSRWATSLAERLCTFLVLKLGGLSDAAETATTSLLHISLQCCLWLLGSFSRCGQVNGMYTVCSSALLSQDMRTYEGTNLLFVINTFSSLSLHWCLWDDVSAGFTTC